MANFKSNPFYYQAVSVELDQWRKSMRRQPSIWNDATKRLQRKINNIIPEKVHKVITKAIKEITKAVIFGADFTTSKRKTGVPLDEIEINVKKRIKFYASSAALEGAATGFGGFLLSMADFPLWLTLKMKMLFEIASWYGYDTKDYKERIYILHIFQLTFSSQRHRNEVFEIMENWEIKKEQLPDDIGSFDWRTFQLEYRDYIDLAKLLQLIPGIGAVAGALVNHKLTSKLGKTAINAYCMRDESFRNVKLLN